MTGQDGFKGITRAQSAVIECWQNKRCENGFVQRADIEPCQFGMQLASISVIEVKGAEAKFRIAGSKLREIIGMEARGRTVDEVRGEAGDTFALGLDVVISSGQPVGGIIQTPRGRHAWLRLPLVGQDGRISQVLCHDELLRGREAIVQTDTEQQSIPAYRSAVAA